jgi:hypothetical protein
MYLFFSKEASRLYGYCEGKLTTGELVNYTGDFQTKENGEKDYKWDDKIYLGEGEFIGKIYEGSSNLENYVNITNYRE